MKSSTTRRLAALMGASLLAALVVSASPAAAADVDTAVTCRTLLSTTPGIEADIDGDGNPDFRAPRIYDVVLCSDASVGYTTHLPWIDNCSEMPKSVRCMAVRIPVLPAYVGAHAEATLCYSIEGLPRECRSLITPIIRWSEPFTMCVGYDLDGGAPCSGSMFAIE